MGFRSTCRISCATLLRELLLSFSTDVRFSLWTPPARPVSCVLSSGNFCMTGLMYIECSCHTQSMQTPRNILRHFSLLLLASYLQRGQLSRCRKSYLCLSAERRKPDQLPFVCLLLNAPRFQPVADGLAVRVGLWLERDKLTRPRFDCCALSLDAHALFAVG